ncbi:rhodanese-like domain-containing protein [Candidatus Venteria ishoeyi]|uniref:rhodanese-like domain-containing protein n=1 Tax=Candidatus Venteria ishoeyi TaxID=1899563 RepID=UPI0025A58830|nr:rhodanese-like domain-containing protein [Candidatus Venteria ishoeyi]MDM8546299.1 rhodanese-like domain-containing protein [Candidatus Venteria ishoeyi]
MFVKEIEASELSEWMAQTDTEIQLIDVRTPGEIAAGIIPGTEAMPLTTLPMRTHEVQKNQKVVFYCRTGARSAQACMFLAQQGFDNVYNLRGGIMNWARNQLPIESGAHLVS